MSMTEKLAMTMPLLDLLNETLNYTNTSFDKVYSATIGIWQLVLGNVVGFLLNCVAWKYFANKSSVFSEIFKVAVIVDILTCTASFPVSLSYLTHRSPAMFANQILCTGWFIVWFLISRISIHIVAILSLLRTIKLFVPLTTRLNVKMARAIISADILATAVIFTWRYTPFKNIHFSKSLACCIPDFDFISQVSDFRAGVTFLLLAFVPLIIMFVSCVTSCCKLALEWKRTELSPRSRNLRKKWFYSATTIVLIVGSYLVVNLPLIALTIYLRFFSSKHKLIDKLIDQSANELVPFELWSSYSTFRFRLFLLNYCLVYSYVLNSICNPLIYIWRMHDVRSYVHGLWVVLVNVFRNTNTQAPEGLTILRAPERLTTPAPDRLTTPALERLNTPAPDRLTTPAPERRTTPTPERLTTPTPEILTTPAPERLTTPAPERLTTPTPERLTTLAPERLTTPAPERLTTPTPERLTTPVPERLTTPAPDRLTTPVTERLTTPVPERLTTPATERLTTPAPDRLTTPVLERLTTPAPERLTTPAPERLTTPTTERLSTPAPERLTTPAPERLSTPATERLTTPATERLTTPTPEILITPAPERLTTPAPERLSTPATERLTTPATERLTTPATERLTTPTPEILITPAPSPERLTTPAPERLSTPATERLTTPATERLTTPTPERLTTPAPDRLTTTAIVLLPDIAISNDNAK